MMDYLHVYLSLTVSFKQSVFFLSIPKGSTSLNNLAGDNCHLLVCICTIDIPQKVSQCDQEKPQSHTAD